MKFVSLHFYDRDSHIRICFVFQFIHVLSKKSTVIKLEVTFCHACARLGAVEATNSATLRSLVTSWLLMKRLMNDL